MQRAILASPRKCSADLLSTSLPGVAPGAHVTGAAAHDGDSYAGRLRHFDCQGRDASVLRVGFVPLTDCAPLIMAHELGLFRKYGLRVALSRELGWATIRDKVIHREL